MSDWNTTPAYRRQAPTDRWARMGPQQRALYVALLELERPAPRRPRARLAAGPAHVPQRQRGPAQNRFSAGSSPAMRTASPPRPERTSPP